MKATTLVVLALCSAPFSQAASLIALLGSTPGSQSLNLIDSAAPGTLSPIALTGLEIGETLLAIDYRPATGQLFGLGSASNLYTINTFTGLATIAGTGLAAGIITNTNYGFDFNPTIDRIRIVSTDNSNSVGNPNTGGTQAVVTPVFYEAGDVNEGQNPNLVHHAYTNNFDGALTSQLYAIDSNLNILVTQANNAGTLGTVGSLGVDIGELGGFDIDGADGIAYAALSVGGLSGLYTIDLTSGQASLLGAMSGEVMGMAVVPEPSSALLLSFGALALLRRNRTK